MKLKIFSPAGLFCLIFLFSFSSLYAEIYVPQRFITVNQAQSLPNDSWVMISGYIVNSLPGGKHYTFRDSAGGEIVVEIDWKIWRGLYAGVSDRLDIYGEVKISRGQVSIKVRALTASGADRTQARSGQAVAITTPIPVSEARALPKDSWVVLSGYIVNSLSSNSYTFRDAQSAEEITVEIGRKEWRGLSVAPSDRVEISGEVEIKKGQVLIKVRAVADYSRFPG